MEMGKVLGHKNIPESLLLETSNKYLRDLQETSNKYLRELYLKII